MKTISGHFLFLRLTGVVLFSNAYLSHFSRSPAVIARIHCPEKIFAVVTKSNTLASESITARFVSGRWSCANNIWSVLPSDRQAAPLPEKSVYGPPPRMWPFACSHILRFPYRQLLCFHLKEKLAYFTLSDNQWCRSLLDLIVDFADFLCAAKLYAILCNVSIKVYNKQADRGF